jgi:probable blue pigment (indigoidine) exporter
VTTTLHRSDHQPPVAAGTARLTALAAIAPATWGTTYLVTTEFLPPGQPLLSATIRALPVGLVLLAATRRLPRGDWWWRAALLGVLNIGAFFALLFVAAYRLPGGIAATLGAAQPLMVAGIALALFGERPTRWRLGWGVVGIVGIALLVLRGRVALDPVGLLAATAGTAVMACGIVLTKRWGRPVGLLTFTGWQLTAGGLFLAPLALLIEGIPTTFDTRALAGYSWLAIVGTLLAYVLWFQGISRLPVAAVSFLPLLSPIVATLLGWAVLGQSLTLPQAAGFGLALLAVSAAQLPPRSPVPTAFPPASPPRQPTMDHTLDEEPLR